MEPMEQSSVLWQPRFPPVGGDGPFPAPGRRRRVRRWALGVLSGGVAVALFAFGAGLARDGHLAESPLLGRAAPAFSLPRLDEAGTVSSADLHGRRYIVNFWAPWCVPCRAEHAVLRDVYGRWHGQGLEMVGVVFSDEPDAARAFRNEMGGDWPLVGDPAGRSARAYGVSGIPATFVVDADGVVLAKMIGAVDAATVEQFLGQLDPTPSTDPAVPAALIRP